MAQTLTRLLVHVVFSTKNRGKLILEDVESDLYRYIGGICRNQESPLFAMGGTENHVHLLVSLSKTVAMSELVMQIKRDSSKWIKSRSPRFSGFQWQEGYAAFSIGESQVERVRAYIERQKLKHQTVTFEDELLAFLVKYRVPYDPQYIWT